MSATASQWLKADQPLSAQQGRQTADQVIPEADIQRGPVSAASRPFKP
jgi:hypothetical protein